MASCSGMNLLFTFVAVLFVSGQISAAPVTKDCLNGESDPAICCQNVLETQEVLLRNPDNCKTYYRCVHQQPLLKPCPSDLHWSVATSRCELSELAGCTTNNITNKSINQNCPKEPSKECLAGIKDPKQCCENYPDWINIFLKIIGDCDSYYICQNNKPVIQHCPEGLKYNSQTKRCEWNSNEECVLLSTTQLPSETTTKKPCNTTDPELSPPNCLNGESDPETCCKGIPYWEEVLLKNADDCSTYYQCVHEIPVLRPCPAGLHWSVSAHRCDWPDIAECEEVGTTGSLKPTTSSPQSTTKIPNRTTSVPHSTTNSPPVTTSRSPTGTTCKPTSPPNYDCLNGVLSPEICCKGVPYWEDILIRNPEDCGTYYQCVHEKPILRPCPAGLHWSVSANRCEWPNIAGCEETGTTSNPKSTTSILQSTTKSPNPTNSVPHSTTNSPPVTTSESPPGTTCKPTSPPNDDCLNGILSPEICCKRVPYWEDVLIINPEDCGTYYQCIDEEPVLRPCPAGLHWSVSANRCEWPEIAGCKETSTTGNFKPTTSIPLLTTKSSNPTTSVSHSTTNSPPVTTSESLPGTTCKPTSRPNDECLNGVLSPENCCKGVPYWEDVLIRNPEDCGTYYQCVHEKPVLRPCPAGLHWSGSANRCEWPNIAGCEEIDTTGNPKSTTSILKSTTNSPNRTTSVPHSTTYLPAVTTSESPTGTTCNPTSPPNDNCLNGVLSPEICCKGVPYWEDVLIRNPEDCGTYYQCVHEKPVLRPCPAGLHWSVSINRCEWPEIAGCEERSTTGYPKSTTSISQSTAKSPNPTTSVTHSTTNQPPVTTSESPPGTTCKPTSPPNDDCLNGMLSPEICCKRVPYWEDVLIINPEDCGTYYQCVDEKPVLRPCPAGLHWSVSANRCEWPEIAGCKETSTTGNFKPTTSSPLSTTKTPNPTTSVSNSTTNSPPVTTSESLPGTTCKPTRGPNDECLNGVLIPENCCKGVPYWEDVLIRNPEDCGTYYQCVHEKPVLRPCPAGLHWSGSANRCEWPNIAGCEEIGTTGNPKSTTSISQSTTNSPNRTTSMPHSTTNSPAVTTTESPTGATCNPTSPPNDNCLNGVLSPEICCKGVPYWEDVLIRNPEDCGTYYQCVHEKPVLRPCPAGLHWSVSINRCEWPEIAECEERSTTGYSKPTTSISQSTTKSPNPTTSVPHSTTNSPPVTPSKSPPETTCKPTSPPNNDCLNGILSPEICCKGVPHWEDVLIRNPEDCGTYYQCVHEKPILRPCPAGLHWGVSVNRCEWPNIAGCEETGSTGNPKSTTSILQSTTKSTHSTTSVPFSTTNSPRVTTSESPTGTTCKPTSPPNSDCFNGVLSPEICCKGIPYWKDIIFKNSEDCGTYYQCVHENPVLRPCPAGLHWSVSANRCEWPEIAGCEEVATTTNSKPTSSSPESSSDDPQHTSSGPALGTTCKYSNPEKPTNSCVNGLSDPALCCTGIPYWEDILLRNSEDCGTYYQCVNEKPVLKPCPAGLHWSVSAIRCEWPEIAGCEALNMIPTDNPNKPTSLSQQTSKVPSKPRAPSKEDCLHGLVKPDKCCEGVLSNADVLLRNTKDCGAYYQCVHGKPMLRFCPDGLHFSVEFNRCEWKNVANCKEYF